MKEVHTCHWPGCSKEVSPALWGCKSHWLALPRPLRDSIWKTYVPGQEVSKTPSPEYLAAARNALAWITSYSQQRMIPTLSIRQPWAWLIVHGFKDIENRDWYTPLRGRFLVHASKTMTKTYFNEAVWWLKEMGIYPDDMPGLKELPRGGIVGEATLLDCVRQSASPWFMEGGYGFVLTNAKPFEFVEWTGTLQFFNVPESALDRRNQQLEHA